jgi:dTDP-4-amino-4,6-dideoxygalactose transaminase
MLFNIPFTCSDSFDNVKNLIENPILINEGIYQKKCVDWFEQCYPEHSAFMTTSCTRAMELISLSLDLSFGDEIILSPYTYVGVGNAFSNYGAKLVFVDIDASTMNINVSLIEKAITKNTKAIVAMHYASIPCELDKIRAICDKYNVILIEDNAQGIQAFYNKQLLGSFGDFSCISFDILKNISCNEGGVLLCRNEWLDRVDVAYNNGTNKTAFSKGLVKKYEWTNKGSKFGMSEYTAAVLYPLLEKSAEIISERKKIWTSLYNKIIKEEILKDFVPQKLLDIEHNGHLAYLKFKDIEQRNKIIDFLSNDGIPSLFHYIPLDDSVEGRRNSQTNNICENSLRESNCLLRLPMHNYLTEDDQMKIVRELKLAVMNSV